MSGILAVKLRRDLRAAWSRVLLMAVAIAVSLIVFGGVLYAWAVMDRESAAAYAGTEPASATLLLEERIDPDRMAAIAADAEADPRIVAATGRTQFDGDFAVDGSASDFPLQVFVAAPDDPLEMARFEVLDGAWPPAADEVYLGERSFDLLGVEEGDVLTVDLPSGATAELRVAGTVYDPSLAPAEQEQRGRAYLSAAALGAAGGFDQLKIQAADPGGTEPTRDRAAAVAVAGDLAGTLRADYGLEVVEIQVPEPYEHPHQGQVNGIALAVLAGAAAALVLSAVLVANMLNGLFTRQIPQIGIMKAVGARSGRIGRFYAAMTLLVSAAATAVALGPAVLLGRAGARFVTDMLGFREPDLAAPWWVWAVVLAAGLGLAPLMSLVPLVRTARTTVRQAIDHSGRSARPSRISARLAGLGRIRVFDRLLLMALRNTMRRPTRFALAAGLLAAAGTVFVTAMSLGAGTDAIDADQRAERAWDVQVGLAEAADIGQVAAVIEGVEGVTRAEGWSRTAGAAAGPEAVPVTRTYPDQGHGRLSIVAVPQGTRMQEEPDLVEGRWLEDGETGAVVLNQNARDTVPEVEVGGAVRLFVGGEAADWTVVGVVQERTGGSAAYVTAEGLAVATGNPIESASFRVATTAHDEASRDEAAAAVEAALTGAGYRVRSSESVGRMEEALAGHLGPIISVMLALAVVVGVVGAIGLASTMSANVLDRTRELGVMHAIGAGPKAVRRVIVAEGLFLALASCVLAVVPTLAATAALGSGVGEMMLSAPLPFRISLPAVGIWVLLVLLGSVLATEAAAARASRITVREALAYL